MQTLRPGRYIINNGRKKKGEIGRFLIGTHADVRKLLQGQPGVEFTEKPSEAHYVIVPEGVRDIGSKLRRLNPALGNPDAIIPMDKIALPSVMASRGYSDGRRRHRHRKALSYIGADGRAVAVPGILEPTDQAYYGAVARVDSTRIVNIPETDYVVARRQIRGPPLPVPVPQEAPGTGPPMAGFGALGQDSVTLQAKSERLHALLNTIERDVPQQQPPAPEQKQVVAPPPPLVTTVPPMTASLTTLLNMLKTRMDWIGALNITDFVNVAMGRATTNVAFNVMRSIDSLETLHIALKTALAEKLGAKGISESDMQSMKADYEKQVCAALEARGSTIDEILSNHVRTNRYDEEFLKRVHTSAMNALASLTNVGQLDADQAIYVLFQALLVVRVYLRALDAMNSAYRSKLQTQIAVTNIGFTCTADNLVCESGDDQPKPIWVMIPSMANVACKIISHGDAESKAAAPLYEANPQCAAEQFNDTIADLYKFVYVGGYLGGQFSPEGNPAKMASIPTCNVLVFVLENTMPEIMRKIQSVHYVGNLLNSLGRKQDNDTTMFSENAVYRNFYRFLRRKDPLSDTPADRNDAWARLQAEISSRSELFLNAFTAGLFLCLADFCSGSNSGSYLRWSTSKPFGGVNRVEKMLRGMMSTEEFS